MSEDRLQAGVIALRDGDKRLARRLLGQVVNEDPRNATAWWYMTAALEDPEQKIHCLRQVLRLRPDHEEAQQLLDRLERRAAQVKTPAREESVVLETRQTPGGELEVLPHEPDFTDDVDASDFTVAAAAVLVALIAIIVTVVLVWSGSAGTVLGIRSPDLEPTDRILIFDPPACTASENEQTLIVFVNNSGVAVAILEGPSGSETEILALEPGAQGRVEVRPAVSTRYAVSSDVQGVAGSGVRIEVPRGSACRVPVH